MNDTLIIALLVAALLVGAVLFLSVERSAGPESTAPPGSRPIEELSVEPTRIAPLVPGGEESVLSVAEVEDLLQYPTVFQEEGLSRSFYTVRLPQTELVVVLRPITEDKYASFQVRAIGYEIIEQQMLAAALVLPAVDEVDVAGFPSELVSFLQQKVNEISGFEVFETS